MGSRPLPERRVIIPQVVVQEVVLVRTGHRSAQFHPGVTIRITRGARELIDGTSDDSVMIIMSISFIIIILIIIIIITISRRNVER